MSPSPESPGPPASPASPAGTPPPITAAIIPAAGLGTRLLPATRAVPKEMLPIVDKPVVQYVVEELAAAGLDRILIVTGRRKRTIEDHFDADPELRSQTLPGAGVRLLYTRQPEPRGLGDAIRQGDGLAGPGGAVVVALGDAIVESARAPGIVDRLIEAHTRHRASATIAVATVPDAEVARYGIVTGEPLDDDEALQATAIVEKPDPLQVASRLAVAARYVLGPEVFSALRDASPGPDGEIGLTEALQRVIDGGGRVLAVPLAPGERRHDIGSVDGYVATFLHYALAHPRLGPAVRAQVGGAA